MGINQAKVNPQIDLFANEFAKSWVDSQSVELINLSESFVYKVIDQEGKPFALRIIEAPRRTVSQVEAEMTWIEYLQNNNISCAPVRRSKAGNLLETAEIQGQVLIGSFFEWANGRFYDEKLDFNETFFQLLGSSIGRMHRVTKQFSAESEPLDRPQWASEDYISEYRKFVPASEKSALRELDKLMDWAQSLETSSDYALTHTDLHQGNYFINGLQLQFFDFDDCGYNWLAYDFFIPIYYFRNQCGEDASCQQRLASYFEHYKSAYLEHNPLAQTWLDYGEHFIRLRRAIMHSWFCKNYRLDKLDPEMVTRVASAKKHFDLNLPV